MLFDPSSTALPKRSELPKIPGAPDGAAWFWGKDDELGRLNLLTPKRVSGAAGLIRSGEIVNLNWRADLPNPPAFGRQKFKHTISPLGEAGFDDLYDMNTQSGSQWDGFRHVGLRHDGGVVFYNGLTVDEIYNTHRCGMQAWAKHGIAGRGVLIDYWGYVGGNYDPISSHRIPLSEIQACAKKQGVEFQHGDILLVRSGFVSAYNGLDDQGRAHLGTLTIPEHTFAGVEATEDMLDFLHDNYFSAVVGDAPAFEAWPVKELSLHQYLLPRWGVPIGEMWDLEQLAETCKRKQQYTFFISSVPANVPGGVGSHPNAIAIF
ncbi:uncharacterized protein Z519_06951 [Cladophialophora bantiana CBS 173.52]|uniref:Cyclase n=1 Tax=Cladophialophora bantiana (strain ATCC 10958 / CBS 173.52 / CDC B-1940 / NIH 8579) TaxID=1442370 RepID=A0A0D2I537_CLAB1|nr:uncharacterized protein Z519_06951 [Cladophialophora bantiana CBS 173.52]KIW91969.1 hypothetical protein Z519_06951 [Cladophialophora bantiana CBS 173.52]